MSEAAMPTPPGGRLKCPIGFEPWIEVDNDTQQLNAECKEGPSGGQKAFPSWVYKNLQEVDKTNTELDDPAFRRALSLGYYRGETVTYHFALFQDTDEPFEVPTNVIGSRPNKNDGYGDQPFA